jgi:hypothetical protein
MASSQDYMLQINNILRARAEGKNSLDQIIESAIALHALSEVNKENNCRAYRKVVGWDRGFGTR